MSFTRMGTLILKLAAITYLGHDITQKTNELQTVAFMLTIL